MLTKSKIREFLKCSNNYKYFKNNYLVQDCNSDALTFICWIMLYKSNKNIAYITKYKKSGEQLIKTVCRFLDNIPRWMKPEFKSTTEIDFKLENGNCFCVISNDEKLKGVKFDYIIINSFSIFNDYKKELIPQMKQPINNISRRIIYLI